MGKGGGQHGLSLGRRPKLDRMREFRERMRHQNLGPSSKTTSVSNMNNIETPVPAARSLERTLSDGDIVPPVITGKHFHKRECNRFIINSHDVTINRHVNLRPLCSATLTSTFTAGGPGVAGGGYQMGKGGGRHDLPIGRRPELDRMPEFCEHTCQQNLCASSNNTQASIMNKNMELVPAARSLERALSKSTAPTAAKGAREAPKVGGDRAGGEGELARVTLLRLTNPKNEVTFTTGDIRSVHANIAHQEGLSKEFITPQMLQGGHVTVSEELGKFLVEEEEVELIHREEGAKVIQRSIFTVKRLDAQGRDVDDDTEQKVKDARVAKRLEHNQMERECTYRFFIDGTRSEMLIMKTMDPVRQNKAVDTADDLIAYLHPAERQAKAVDVNGDLIATNA